VPPESNPRLRLQSTYIGPVTVALLWGLAVSVLLRGVYYLVQAMITAIVQGTFRSCTFYFVAAAESAITGAAIAWVGFVLAFWLYPSGTEGSRPLPEIRNPKSAID